MIKLNNLIVISFLAILLNLFYCNAQPTIFSGLLKQLEEESLQDHIIPASSGKTKCDANKMFDCSDCKTRIICQDQDILYSEKCLNKTPYCNQGICVSKRPSVCDFPKSKLCPGNGTYPSPESCDRYSSCSTEGVRTEETCSPSLVYDPESGLCKNKTSATDCPTLCSNIDGEFIVYPLKKQLFFYCKGNDSALLSCNQNEEFNPDTKICEFACNERGQFPNSLDDTRYYLCIETEPKVFEKNDLYCGYDRKFNTTTATCELK